MIKRLFFFLYLIFSAHTILYAQNRIQQSINSNWQFQKEKDTCWQQVSLPHSWNTQDVNDDKPGYYRGKGIYKKTLYIPVSWKEKAIYLNIEGANQITTVWLNGKQLGQHIGGYTRFRLLLNPFIQFDQTGKASNELRIEVDNSHQEDIPPLSADFTFFGGLYRQVSLLAVDPIHFDLENEGSSGVFIQTPEVNADEARVHIHGGFINTGSKKKNILILQELKDANGKSIARTQEQYTIGLQQKMAFEQTLPTVSKPILWSPESPYLYRVTSTIKDSESGQVLDEITQLFGFRWYRFDPEKGFFLNGKAYKLMGASRHQDYKDRANALPTALHLQDMKWLKDMGANFLRIAHYPQDPSILEACDRLGILTSVEIPIVNRITESEAFYQHCLSMQTEMIRQNFNHPSVIIWAYMNEVLLSPRFADDKPRQETYFQHVAELAAKLEALTRKEDPSRYTMIPNHGNFELYNRVGLTKIPQLVGWNLYQGWYGGKFDDFGKFLDMHHRLLPDKPVLVTEYGADADDRIRAVAPLRFDKSIDYALLYHQAYLKAILERPFVAGAMAWNLVDFNSEQRADSDPHINNKGLLTVDRKPKDTYYLYQAYLSDKPYVHLASRAGDFGTYIADSSQQHISTQNITVFSNLAAVSLSLNGKQIGSSLVKDHIANFAVPLKAGKNLLSAYPANGDSSCLDQASIAVQLIPYHLNQEAATLETLNISLGDKRSIRDDALHEIWLPEQAYRPGSWGYLGGEPFVMKNSGRQPYGTDRNILGTDLDPVYATQRLGLEGFRFDVPTGVYEITLLFAELLSDQEQAALVYNLSNSEQDKTEQLNSRAFTVWINKIKVIENLGNDNELKPQQVYKLTTEVVVNDPKEGIQIRFEALKGKAILNGIQLRRKY